MDEGSHTIPALVRYAQSCRVNKTSSAMPTLNIPEGCSYMFYCSPVKIYCGRTSRAYPTHSCLNQADAPGSIPTHSMSKFIVGARAVRTLHL